MKTGLKTLALAGTILAAPFLANAASAASIIGLSTARPWCGSIRRPRRSPARPTSRAPPNVVGIDVRPADGMLYAVTADGGIYTVDAKTGAATMKSKLSETLKAGITVTVDFNPAADRLRVITSDGTNLRINVDDGKTTVDGTLKFKDGDAKAGKTPKVVAGAYTNSANPKPAATALYDIDEAGHLLTQAPPNDGILNTVGIARREARRPDGVQHRQQGRGQRGLAGDRRHALLGRSEDRQGDRGRQARRRHRQAHRHRLDRLKLFGARPARAPTALVR